MLTDADRDQLQSFGRRATYRRGSVLFREGDAPGPVFLLLDGRVKIHVCTPTGREVLLGIKERGELLGELAAFDRLPRSATATVTADLTCTVVPAAGFCEFVDARPAVAMHLLRSLSGQLRAATSDQVVRSEGTVGERVATRLLSLALRFDEHSGSSVSIPLSIGHDDLAAWTSASREAVSRSMAELRRAGVVTTTPGRITVTDLDGLRQLSVAPSRPKT